MKSHDFMATHMDEPLCINAGAMARWTQRAQERAASGVPTYADELRSGPRFVASYRSAEPPPGTVQPADKRPTPPHTAPYLLPLDKETEEERAARRAKKKAKKRAKAKKARSSLAALSSGSLEHRLDAVERSFAERAEAVELETVDPAVLRFTAGRGTGELLREQSAVKARIAASTHREHDAILAGDSLNMGEQAKAEARLVVGLDAAAAAKVIKDFRRRLAGRAA